MVTCRLGYVWSNISLDLPVYIYIYIYIYMASGHSAAEHRASTRIFHLTLFLASVLIFSQVLLTPLASSSTLLRPVFFGLPLPRLPWGFYSRACLAVSSDDFRSVAQPSPLAFPDLQIYSWLVCVLPQRYIHYLVRPGNSQYFP